MTIYLLCAVWIANTVTVLTKEFSVYFQSIRYRCSGGHVYGLGIRNCHDNNCILLFISPR